MTNAGEPVGDARSLFDDLLEDLGASVAVDVVVILHFFEVAYYCSTSTTRRFFARPSSVRLVATGARGPTPLAWRRAGAILYFETSAATTASARCFDSAMFAA